MKKIFIVLLLIVMLSILTACYEERGYAYKHLNDYEPGKIHSSYTGNDSVLKNSSTDGIGGTYEYLQQQGCEARPHCCGDFSAEEIWYRDLEIRAGVENNSLLCNQLPNEDLVVDCPYEDTYSFYSKARCFEQFN